MVAFAGWHMPVAYSSQIEEHHAVRRAAGMFDVSHMTIVDIAGSGARAYLQRLLANDVGKLERRRDADCAALYTCMLNEQGGVLDDLIVYRFDDDSYRLIVNAATGEKDLAWLRGRAAELDLHIAERDDLALLAVQGPEARRAAAPVVPGAVDVAALRPFTAARADGWLVARTGYTGEDGTGNHAPSATGCRPLVRVAVPRCGAVRARRPRHAAPRGRVEPLRPGHGRVGHAP